jgi:hypothetical protein
MKAIFYVDGRRLTIFEMSDQNPKLFFFSKEIWAYSALHTPQRGLQASDRRA